MIRGLCCCVVRTDINKYTCTCAYVTSVLSENLWIDHRVKSIRKLSDNLMPYEKLWGLVSFA